jgi:hypothetical protein
VRSRLGASFTEARRFHFAKKGGRRETRSTPTTVRSHGGLRRPLGDGEEGNAAHLESNHGLRWVKEMEGGEAKRLARSGERWCGGECARARRQLRRQWCLRLPPRLHTGKKERAGRLRRGSRDLFYMSSSWPRRQVARGAWRDTRRRRSVPVGHLSLMSEFN